MQIAFYAASALIDGRDQVFAPDMTPTIQLANNLSVAVTALIAVLVTARVAKVPWRALLSHPRAFDVRRLWVYGGLSVCLVGAGALATALLAPETTGWVGFGLSPTTWALLAVSVLTTPLQSAGEELIFRSAMMPAIASWVRSVRPAIALGMLVSSILFAVIHVPGDPWLFAHLTTVGLATAAMAVISRGIEAPIAFHVANNLVTSILNTTLAAGEAPVFERSAGAAGPSYLILMAVNVAVVGVVWWRERSRRCWAGVRP